MLIAKTQIAIVLCMFASFLLLKNGALENYYSLANSRLILSCSAAA
jgi:hypothetical protein